MNSATKRILLLDTGKEWGGGTNSMIELLKRLDRDRYQVTCCFYNDYRKGESGPFLSEELATIGIPLMVMPPVKQPLWAKFSKELIRAIFHFSPVWREKLVKRVDFSWRVLPRATAIRRLLLEGDYELLYMNNQPSSNQEGYLATEGTGVAVVQHCRSTPSLSREEVTLTNRVVDQVICVSQGVAEILSAQKIDRSRLRVVYNAIDCQQVLPPPADLGDIDGLPVIGTVGRLTGIKAVGHLIEAVARLHDVGITSICVVVGEGEQYSELAQLAANRGIADLVRFVGFQDKPLAWVQAMDICVLCSLNEGLPRVVLEAMLASKPMVGSCVTGTRELIVENETGLLYEYGDVSALTAALKQLLSDPGRRQQMGLAAHTRVKTHFSIDAYVKGVAMVLDEALQ